MLAQNQQISVNFWWFRWLFDKEDVTLPINLLFELNYTQVSNLCVSAGVPVWVINDDSVASSQIDSQSTNFSSQQEYKNGFVL